MNKEKLSLKCLTKRIRDLSRVVFAWTMHKYDALRDLVPFVQFKKREKHPWRSVTFSEVAG